MLERYSQFMTPSAIVHNAFKITDQGVVVFLTHSLQGLPQGTILTSEKTGNKWKVHARVLMEIITEHHKLFENENYEYLLLRFKSEDEKQKSIRRIIDEESSGKFQYLLRWINHTDKPIEGEMLQIEKAITTHKA